MHRKNVGSTFFGCIFWVPIPFKQHQNTSGCGTENIISNIINVNNRTLKFYIYLLIWRNIELKTVFLLKFIDYKAFVEFTNVKLFGQGFLSKTYLQYDLNGLLILFYHWFCYCEKSLFFILNKGKKVFLFNFRKSKNIFRR